jgi:hypothetical protein
MSLRSSLFSRTAQKRSQNRSMEVNEFRVLSVAIALLIVVSGCSSEKRVPVFPVAGKVSFQGAAPAGALVVLQPVGSKEPTEIAPTGTVKADGSFALTSYDQDDGAPVGDYVAVIQWFKNVPALNGAGPNVLPKQYASAKSSPVKVSVSNGPVEIPPIIIK